MTIWHSRPGITWDAQLRACLPIVDWFTRWSVMELQHSAQVATVGRYVPILPQATFKCWLGTKMYLDLTATGRPRSEYGRTSPMVPMAQVLAGGAHSRAASFEDSH